MDALDEPPFAWADLAGALVARAPEAAADPDRIRFVRAPGRVNLIGEHTDYNLGYVLPAAIDREIRIAYLPTADRRVELTRLDTGECLGFDLGSDRARDGSWLDYVAGTAWALAEAGLPMHGLRGVIASDLPENSGLSSSAAIELAAPWSLLDDPRPRTDRMDLARLCQRAENGYVGVQSGLMDQFAVSCGVAEHALLLDCRSLEWRPVALPDGVRLVVLHSGSRRKLDGSSYNERRSQCEAAVAALAAPRPVDRLAARRQPGAAGRRPPPDGPGRRPTGRAHRGRERAGPRHGRRDGSGRPDGARRPVRGRPRVPARPVRDQLAGARRPRRDRRGRRRASSRPG